MRDNIVQLTTVSDSREPSTHLEQAKAENLAILLIIGETADGVSFVGGNANSGEALLLMERAKHEIVHGDDD